MMSPAAAGLPRRRRVLRRQSRRGGVDLLLPQEAARRRRLQGRGLRRPGQAASPPCPPAAASASTSVPWPMRLDAPQIPAGNEIQPAFVGPVRARGDLHLQGDQGGPAATTGKVKLVADPRSPYSAEDRALQQQTALAVYDDLDDLTYLTDAVVDLRDQARARAEAVGAGQRARQAPHRLRRPARGAAPAAHLQRLARRSRARSSCASASPSLYGAMTGYLGRPTASQLARVPALEKELADAPGRPTTASLARRSRRSIASSPAKQAGSRWCRSPARRGRRRRRGAAAAPRQRRGLSLPLPVR